MKEDQMDKILIVDDDLRLRQLLERYLRDQGFSARAVEGAEEMDRVMAREYYDLLVLDLMMPGEDGLAICRRLRGAKSDIPIIMLTAKGDDVDRIAGLELGADDYLPKPFNPRELLARLNAILRRIDFDGGRGVRPDSLQLKVGGVVLNGARQTVRVEDREVELSSTEFKILKALMERPNTVLTRDQIMDMAQGKDFMAFDRSIDVHISKLRVKLEADPKSPKRIRTVWGSGYMFVETP